MRLAAAAGSLLKENQKPCISHVQVLMQATPNCGHAGQFINISHCPHTCGKKQSVKHFYDMPPHVQTQRAEGGQCWLSIKEVQRALPPRSSPK
jgi:hypothetical protein